MSTTKLDAIQKRLEAAQERVKQLKAQQAAVAARQRAQETKKRRTDETRKKILAGAFMLSKHSDTELAAMLDSYLIEERDRVLFGLPSQPADAGTLTEGEKP